MEATNLNQQNQSLNPLPPAEAKVPAVPKAAPPAGRPKPKIALFILVFLFSLGLGSLLAFIARKPVKLPETFVTTLEESYYGFFELEADKTKLATSEEINITIKLTTSGKSFNTALATIKWNTDDLEYKNLVFKLKENDGQPAPFSSAIFEKEKTASLVMAQYASSPAKNLKTTEGVATDFAVFTLAAKKDNPNTAISLSDKKEDFMFHIEPGTDNYIDQGRASQTQIVLGELADFLLNLKTDLEKKDDDSSDAVTIKLIQGEQTITTKEVTTDTQGEKKDIEMEDAFEDSYKVIVKPKGYLSKKLDSVNLTTGVATEINFSEAFLAGDFKDDNVVDVFDFTIFVNNFGKDNKIVDINGNGEVDVFDFTLYVNNYGKEGEE